MDPFPGPDQLDVFPPYKGGRTCVHGGYVWEFLPGHHLQNMWGWVAQHRLVAEDKAGRPLRRSQDDDVGEVAHHRDECRTNNHPDNIEVMTRRQHRRHHARILAERMLAKITLEQVRTALVGRTIREAAGILGTTHMTLRRRWPELVAPRKRRSPADLTDPKWPGILEPYAADPKWTLLTTSRAVGLGPRAVTQICRASGIPWVGDKTTGRTGRPKGSKNKKPTPEG